MSPLLSCADVEELAPELALGGLSGHERAVVLAHLAGCQGCWALVDELAGVADRLLLLAPEDEPPPGFESRVLARWATGTQEAVSPSRSRRRRWPALALAAALTVVGGSAGALAARGVDQRQLDLNKEYVAVLRHLGGRSLRAARLTDTRGRQVGQAFIYDGAPSWVFVSVDHSGLDGNYMVVCTGSGVGAESWPKFHIADGHGAVGWTALGAVRGLDKVSILDETGHAAYVANLKPNPT